MDPDFDLVGALALLMKQLFDDNYLGRMTTTMLAG
jgi:hypothetical protein